MTESAKSPARGTASAQIRPDPAPHDPAAARIGMPEMVEAAIGRIQARAEVMRTDRAARLAQLRSGAR